MTLLLSWLEPNGFPVQKIVEGNTLADVLDVLEQNDLKPERIVGARRATPGDQFPKLIAKAVAQ